MCWIHNCDSLTTAIVQPPIFNSHLVFSTLSSSGRLPSHARFDLVIVDEACQSVEPDTIVPLQYKCTRLVLIGDPQQLPPTVTKNNGLERSLFERLLPWAQRYERLWMLDEQYRMQKEICGFVSREFYEGKLKTAALLKDRRQPSFTKLCVVVAGQAGVKKIPSF